MKLKDYGRMVKENPNLYQQYSDDEIAYIRSLPDDFVAIQHLKKFPENWNLISQSARRYSELKDRKTKPDYFFPWFHNVTQTNLDTRDKIATLSAEAEYLARLEVLTQAAHKNIPVESLPQIALIEAQHESHLELMREEQRLKIELMDAEARHAERVHGILKKITGGKDASPKRNSLPKAKRNKQRKVAAKNPAFDELRQRYLDSQSGDEPEES
jgi:hypothetical protein